MSENTQNILPAHPELAVQKLIDITVDLRKAMQAEERYIATRDEAAMLKAEERKNMLIGQYQKGAEEFRARLENMRTVPPAMLGRLMNEQGLLGDIAQNNQDMLRIS
jgi:hypothetical protein